MNDEVSTTEVYMDSVTNKIFTSPLHSWFCDISWKNLVNSI